MAGEVRGQDRQCGRKQPRVGARSLVQKRKERLVWGETPFLTHPGAGKWVGRRATTRQLSGYSVANKKGGANTADRASTAHMQPRIAQLTPLDTQTPGEQIYSLGSKGNCRSATGLTVNVAAAAPRSLFHRTPFPWCIISGRRTFYARHCLLKDATPRLKQGPCEAHCRCSFCSARHRRVPEQAPDL